MVVDRFGINLSPPEGVFTAFGVVFLPENWIQIIKSPQKKKTFNHYIPGDFAIFCGVFPDSEAAIAE